MFSRPFTKIVKQNQKRTFKANCERERSWRSLPSSSKMYILLGDRKPCQGQSSCWEMTQLPDSTPSIFSLQSQILFSYFRCWESRSSWWSFSIPEVHKSKMLSAMGAQCFLAISELDLERRKRLPLISANQVLLTDPETALLTPSFFCNEGEGQPSQRERGSVAQHSLEVHAR